MQSIGWTGTAVWLVTVLGSTLVVAGMLHAATAVMRG
jgi:uncharacterized membrane protein YecN with MAPEG domain